MPSLHAVLDAGLQRQRIEADDRRQRGAIHSDRIVVARVMRKVGAGDDERVAILQRRGERVGQRLAVFQRRFGRP